MNKFNFTTDFCIEFYYRGNQTTRGQFFDINGKAGLVYTSSTNLWEIYGASGYIYGTSGSGRVPNVQNVIPVYDNVSHNHIALTRQGQIIRLFINGVLTIQIINTMVLGSTSDQFTFGNNHAGTLCMQGYYSQLRMFLSSIYTRNFYPYLKPLTLNLVEWHNSQAVIAIDSKVGALLANHAVEPVGTVSFLDTSVPQMLPAIRMTAASELEFGRTGTRINLADTSFTLTCSLVITSNLAASGDAHLCTLYVSQPSVSQRLILQLAWGTTYHQGYSGLTANEGGLLVFNQAGQPVAAISFLRTVFNINIKYDIHLSYNLLTNIMSLWINNTLIGPTKSTLLSYPIATERFVAGQLLYLDRYQIYTAYNALTQPTFNSVTINGPSSVPDTLSGQYTITIGTSSGSYTVYGLAIWSITNGQAYGTINQQGTFLPINVASNQSVTIQASVTYNGQTIVQTKIITVTT